MFKDPIIHDSSRASIKDDNVLNLLITHYTVISEGGLGDRCYLQLICMYRVLINRYLYSFLR